MFGVGVVGLEGPRRRGRRFLPYGEDGGWCVFFISFPDLAGVGEVWLTTWQQEHILQEPSIRQEIPSIRPTMH